MIGLKQSPIMKNIFFGGRKGQNKLLQKFLFLFVIFPLFEPNEEKMKLAGYGYDQIAMIKGCLKHKMTAFILSFSTPHKLSLQAEGVFARGTIQYYLSKPKRTGRLLLFKRLKIYYICMIEKRYIIMGIEKLTFFGKFDPSLHCFISSF